MAYALLQHVPERIGTVSGEDSQLLSQFHAWAGNSTRIAQRDDAWLPEEVERALMTEWNQVQNAVNSVYRGAAEGLA